jgi:phosphatidate cytidylyltransferase
MKDLLKRTLSGAVFVIILVGGMLWNAYSFLGLFLVISLLGNLEFLNLMNKIKSEPPKILSLILGILTYTGLAAIAVGCIDNRYLTIIVAFVLLLFVIELFRLNDSPLTNIAGSIASVIYAVVPFALLSFIAFRDGTPESFSGEIVLSMFVLLWIFDSSAYLVGVNFGKNRLYEKISPKKSWEGAIGGLIITLALAWLFSVYFDHLSLVQWIVLSLIVGVFGTLGDLTESMFKRAAGVKDSGNIMPGHGGVLDRFDAMLFISPIVWIYLQWI